jgi:hypothetical protein
VIVKAEGWRMGELTCPPGERELVLEPGLVARIVLDDPGGLPAPPYFLAPSLRAVDGPALPFLSAGPAFNAQGEVVVRPFAPGRHRLLWSVERRTPDSTTSTTVEPSFEQVLEVRDEKGEQLLRVKLDREALAQGLAELR